MKQYRIRMQSNAWYIFQYRNGKFSHGDGPYRTYDAAVTAAKCTDAQNMDEAA